MDDKWDKLKARIQEELDDQSPLYAYEWFEGYDTCLQEMLRHMSKLESGLDL